MPLFEFKCPKCGEIIEVLQKFDDPAPQHCDEMMERILSGGIGVIFRGSGWYETDYKRGKDSGKKGKEGT